MRNDLKNWVWDATFVRYVEDRIRAELGFIRPSLALPSGPWPLDLSFAEEVGIDSLERLQLASALSSSLRLDATEALNGQSTFGSWVTECRRVLREGSRAIAFNGSGSTGRPRPVEYSYAVLEQEVESLSQLFQDATRVVGCVPSHHIYGFLLTVLLPLWREMPVVDVRTHSPASLPGIVRSGDLIVAYPTIWDAVARCGLRWPDGVFGVSSGAPLSIDVAKLVLGDGLRRLVEIYGSTETGGIGWRDDLSKPFRLFSHWRKNTPDFIERRCSGRAQQQELPDIVHWSSDELLTPLKRRDGGVQVGGVNVHVNVVRSCLIAHPDVADASVRLMGLSEGARLKAYVVPRSTEADLALLERELEIWMRERLSGPEQPRSYTFGSGIPTSDSGKPADWPIRTPDQLDRK